MITCILPFINRRMLLRGAGWARSPSTSPTARPCPSSPASRTSASPKLNSRSAANQGLEWGSFYIWVFVFSWMEQINVLFCPDLDFTAFLWLDSIKALCGNRSWLWQFLIQIGWCRGYNSIAFCLHQKTLFPLLPVFYFLPSVLKINAAKF